MTSIQWSFYIHFIYIETKFRGLGSRTNPLEGVNPGVLSIKFCLENSSSRTQSIVGYKSTESLPGCKLELETHTADEKRLQITTVLCGSFSHFYMSDLTSRLLSRPSVGTWVMWPNTVLSCENADMQQSVHTKTPPALSAVLYGDERSPTERHHSQRW